MSVLAISAVFRHSESKGSARLILLAMADEADDRGLLTAYRRSQSWLAQKANVDAGTARRAIATLIELGEIELLSRGDGRESSDYQLIIPGLDEGVQSAPPARAERTPRAREMNGQGAQPDAPTIPLFPADSPLSPVSAAAASPLEGFEDFWRAWPSRGSKAEARKQWPRAVKAAGGHPQVIIDGARRYADDPNLPEPRFIPHAVRWLRGERWNDPPLPPRAGAAKPSAREQRLTEPGRAERFVDALGHGRGEPAARDSIEPPAALPPGADRR